MNNMNLCLRKQLIILWTHQRLLESRINPHRKKLMSMKYVIILGEHGANVVSVALLLMIHTIVFKTVLALNLQ